MVKMGDESKVLRSGFPSSSVEDHAWKGEESYSVVIATLSPEDVRLSTAHHVSYNQASKGYGVFAQRNP